MRRSAGVTAIAVVSLLGSVLVMCLGVSSAAAVFLVPRSTSSPSSPVPPAALLVVAGAFYFLPGVWGLVSGIGLIRLRNWARISTIVFGVLLILFGILTAVMMAIMFASGLPAGEQFDPAKAASVLAIMRGLLGALVLVEISIGAWWVVFLTRPKVAEQFGGTGTAASGTASGRPISITIIAWVMLIGVVGVIFPLVMHTPVPFFLTTLSGLPAALYMIAMAVTVAYSGVGLLRLQPTARLVAIGYTVFAFVNTTVFTLLPGGRARLGGMMEQQRAMTSVLIPGTSSAPPFDPVTMIYFSMATGTILMAVQLYFLVTRKRAFETPARG